MSDPLLQMGRWFGYRDGYADLTRVHTTEGLKTWFHNLATGSTSCARISRFISATT